MWLLLLIVVVAVNYLVIKSFKKLNRLPIDDPRSLYSMGKITRIEYEQMKKYLES